MPKYIAGTSDTPSGRSTRKNRGGSDGYQEPLSSNGTTNSNIAYGEILDMPAAKTAVEGTYTTGIAMPEVTGTI